MRRLHLGRAPSRRADQPGGSAKGRQLTREELVRLAEQVTGVEEPAQTARARTGAPRWATARTTASTRSPHTAREGVPPPLDDFRREHSSANKRVQW